MEESGQADLDQQAACSKSGNCRHLTAQLEDWELFVVQALGPMGSWRPEVVKASAANPIQRYQYNGIFEVI